MIAVIFALFFAVIFAGALLIGIDKMMKDYPDYKGDDFLNDKE